MESTDEIGAVSAQQTVWQEIAEGEVRYLEGTVREAMQLNPGDRVQLWPNDRRRQGEKPDGSAFNDPIVNVKVLPKGAVKGKDLSRTITGLWARLFRNRG